MHKPKVRKTTSENVHIKGDNIHIIIENTVVFFFVIVFFFLNVQGFIQVPAFHPAEDNQT